ncbi:MAG: hypothetical protein ACRDDY_15405, partial [Clostridium sp.]|uniref:hypothetical protein n=1 Tax=Clostridium sp. TaxID=1506 RepID=UPI003EE745C9
METKEKNRKIDFKKLKTEAKKMNTSGGKGSLGIDQVLMVILLVTIPAGISEIPYVLLTKWNSSIYTEVCGLIVMCLIQAPFITAFYLNIIRMIKRGKIEINLPITKKALIITFITQLIGYIIGNDLFKGSILSKAI